MGRTHKDLEVWKVSVEFVTEIYTITKSFPRSELFGLTSQIRRAAVSIPSNISEGAGRKNTREFILFLYYALASLSEVETQIIIAKNVNYLKDTNLIDKKIHHITAMISGLIRSLNNRVK